MLNRSIFLCAIGAALLVLACSVSSGDAQDGIISGPRPGTSVGAGGGPTGASGSGPSPVAGSSSTAGGSAVIIIPNAGSGGGINEMVLDGGEFPADQETLDRIRSERCASWETEPEELPASLMMVLDNSSSMNRVAPGAQNGETKWEVTRDALLRAVPGMMPGAGLPGTMGVGMLFYPNIKTEVTAAQGDLAQCLNTDALVPVVQLGGPDAPHRLAVRDSIQTAVLNRGTNTHDAFKYAFENGILKSTVGGERYMVLVTDGAPTINLGCTDATGNPAQDVEPIVEEVRRAAQAGVKTFLIGSPGSERNREWLSRAAVIGGTALPGCNEAGPNWCHMDMTEAPDFSEALRNGLAYIVGTVTPCKFDSPSVDGGGRIDAALTNVTYSSPEINGGNPVIVVRDDVGECTKGWRFFEEGKVELCPETCRAVQGDSKTLVKVSYGCAAVQSPPK